jgi:hypothetical protein
MPYHNFVCDKNHDTEKLFLSFKAAEGVEEIDCVVCGRPAKRVLSVPFPAHFYGNPDGFYKPSPTKRYSYKLAAEKGNANSAG